MIVGGPCACCGATQASIWYGKKDEMKYCKKAACMRAGGYLAPKKEKEKKVKRARGGGDVKEEPEEEEVVNLDTTVTELVDMYGQR